MMEVPNMKNILIVDDEQEIHQVFKSFLNETMGEQNLTFSNDGVEAMMKCTVEKYDLILLDHKMPRLNGIDLLVALRNGLGVNSETPIVLITGALPEIAYLSDELPNTFLVQKPVDFDRLELIIKSS